MNQFEQSTNVTVSSLSSPSSLSRVSDGSTVSRESIENSLNRLSRWGGSATPVSDGILQFIITFSSGLSVCLLRFILSSVSLVLSARGAKREVKKKTKWTYLKCIKAHRSTLGPAVQKLWLWPSDDNDIDGDDDAIKCRRGWWQVWYGVCNGQPASGRASGQRWHTALCPSSSSKAKIKNRDKDKEFYQILKQNCHIWDEKPYLS